MSEAPRSDKSETAPASPKPASLKPQAPKPPSPKSAAAMPPAFSAAQKPASGTPPPTPVPPVQAPPTAPLPGPLPLAPTGGSAPPRRDFLYQRRLKKLRARKVRRLIRHVEPWSVLKISLVFYLCLWAILLIAGGILWSFAVGSGMVGNLENFVTELAALEKFELNGDQIFRALAIGGLVLVVVAAGFTVLMAVLFNLISDVIGGIRMTVVEEETARFRPRRLRVRRPSRPVPPVPPAGRSPVPTPPPGLQRGVAAPRSRR